MNKIEWEYFFGGSGEHYYKAEIDGVRVEKHVFRGGCRYAVGNMDLAKQKFKTELELIQKVNIITKHKEVTNEYLYRRS